LARGDAGYMATTGTEFCLLGPLAVRCGGTVVAVPPGKQRALLAALLLSAGRAVSLGCWPAASSGQT